MADSNTSPNPDLGGIDDTGVGLPVGTDETLSSYAGPYVSDMLGKGAALADTPYEAYTGPLTAGESDLQTTAFQGIAGLTIPTDEMGAFTPSTISSGGFGGFGDLGGTTIEGLGQAAQAYRPYDGNTDLSQPINPEMLKLLQGSDGTNLKELMAQDMGGGIKLGNDMVNPLQLAQNNTNVQNYMNPYLMAALNPQLEEARRQSEIQRVNNASRLTQAGAYGGGRQAIMDSENQRNLLQNLSGITGSGYRDAYDKAVSQFNVEQDRGRNVQEDINRYGLAALEKTKSFGDDQRGIAAEGITADRLQFEEEKMDPFKKVQFMQSLLDGLPIGATSTNYSEMSDAQRGGAITDLFMGLFGPGSTTSENSGGA